ncbi:MAG TPA: radical SAM protein [Terriglobales bacterium]|jgi:tRNA A37 methylthiotransferase MiaB|nr:radical SAM protein [Terriglobales bacterium]
MTTFFIQQFGCRATQADGAALERQLLDRGCTPAPDPASAAIVVLNTCTVTAAADAQARDSVRKIHAQNPAARLIVTGCYAQRAPEELASLPGVTWVVGNSHKPQIPNLIDALSTGSLSEASINSQAGPSNNFVPTAALFPDSPDVPFHSFVGAQFIAPHLGKISNPDDSLNHANILTGDIFSHPEFLSAPIQGGESHHTRPILKIQDGCNNRCSFCIIPFVRGKSRSLPPDQVIREIQKLTAEHPPEPANLKVGQPILAVSSSTSFTSSTSPAREIPVAQALLPVPASSSTSFTSFTSFTSSTSSTSSTSPAREIVLSGINLGTYGRDLFPRIEFIDLLRRILDETPVERLRISSIEPLDVTQDLIDLFAGTDRIAQHFHMPLQSASDPILAAMHRWYRSEHYARRVQLIHDRLPNAAIGADVIAGFPGETESDHAATLSFIDRLPFTYLHVFSYSPRPGTKAASLPDQVPATTIKRRARELRALGESKSAHFRRAQIGRTLRVLTLHRNASDERDGVTPALSSNYLSFSIPGNHPHNRWIEVEVTTNDSATVSASTNDRIGATSFA